MRRALILTTLSLATLTASAQWDIQDSGSKASLRGIHSLGKGIAWASGTDGTVLRTEDGGYLWQRCTTPPGAEKVDFRGIQGFDANTAIVMSSGKGDLSRLYKTTDGCQTWKLVFTNPDKEGFWDAIQFADANYGVLLGDPVDGFFRINRTTDGGDHWTLDEDPNLKASGQAGAFAASNSALYFHSIFTAFVTGGQSGTPIYSSEKTWEATSRKSKHTKLVLNWKVQPSPFGDGTAAAGGFSIVFADICTRHRFAPSEKGDCGDAIPSRPPNGIAVGGDYLKPDDIDRTAAFTVDGGKTWQLAADPPHGYRSSIAYDAPTKTWITVGPNGTDISTDDGHNWRALKPGPNDAPDADKNWNALSLPFVVGPHGRIGVLRPDAFKATH